MSWALTIRDAIGKDRRGEFSAERWFQEKQATRQLAESGADAKSGLAIAGWTINVQAYQYYLLAAASSRKFEDKRRWLTCM